MGTKDKMIECQQMEIAQLKITVTDLEQANSRMTHDLQHDVKTKRLAEVEAKLTSVSEKCVSLEHTLEAERQKSINERKVLQRKIDIAMNRKLEEVNSNIQNTSNPLFRQLLSFLKMQTR